MGSDYSTQEHLQKLSNLRNQILFLPLEKWITFSELPTFSEQDLCGRWRINRFGSILHVELVEFLEIRGISQGLAYEWFIIVFFFLMNLV